jgi:diaminopimelate decarboxylase
MNCVKTGLNICQGINKVVFEPGRRIVASCGVFVTSVLRKKFSEDCHFMIVDGGMNDFVRPSLYEAYHEIYESKQSDQIKLKLILWDQSVKQLIALVKSVCSLI